MAAQITDLDALRHRLDMVGVEALADHELLALMLGARPLAGSPTAAALFLLESADGISGLARRSLKEMIDLPGLGRAGATRIQAALELGRRLAVPAPSSKKPIDSSTEVAEWFRCRLQDHEREGVYALLLDGRNRALTHLCITQGSWTSCPVDPKVVFSACLRHGAPAVILIHNHPSGDPSPSRDDLALTERMVRAGKVIGVKVLDHLIVGREGFCSMADSNLL